MSVVVNLEKLCQSRFTDVETNQDNLLTKQCERHCEVCGDESFAFARYAGCERNNLFVLFKHELYVGTHRAEYFLHLVVLVLVNNNVGLGFGGVASHSHIGNDGQRSKACHIVVPFYLIPKETEEEEYYTWYG